MAHLVEMIYRKVTIEFKYEWSIDFGMTIRMTYRCVNDNAIL